jgi:lipopolysaccharide/colanic/teichoic acid biosynthesis glycosyltransferase
MGQEVQVVNGSERAIKGVIPAGRESSCFEHSSRILSEQPLYNNVYNLELTGIYPARLPKMSLFNEFLIRATDIIIFALVLLFAAPVMLFIAMLVKLSSPGPVFFKQKRVGEAGKIFTLYKFRTMVDGAEKQTGPVLASKDDGRVTPLGRILRCTRLDELPQLFNVIRGDMSLVGPRPERPYFVSRNRSLQGIRLSVKPGITGLAQVRAFYDLKPEHKLRYDSLYIQNRSLLLNLYILLQTIPVIFLKKGW